MSGTVSGTGHVVIGGIVGGSEHGSLENCSASLTVQGGNIVGGIIGRNTVDGSSCNFNGTIIYTNKSTDHDSIGGIVGQLSDGGTIRDCTFSGVLRVDVKDWENRTLQPYLGGIVGYMTTGSQSGNNVTGTLNYDNLNPDVSWWSWFVTYHHNQQLYCNTIVGKNE